MIELENPKDIIFELVEQAQQLMRDKGTIVEKQVKERVNVGDGRTKETTQTIEIGWTDAVPVVWREKTLQGRLRLNVEQFLLLNARSDAYSITVGDPSQGLGEIEIYRFVEMHLKAWSSQGEATKDDLSDLRSILKQIDNQAISPSSKPIHILNIPDFKNLKTIY